MLNLQFVRVLARAFYGAMILVGLTIMAFSLTAKADPNPPNTRTQTQTGMSGGSRGVMTHEEYPSLPGAEQAYTNMSEEVQRRLRDNENIPYIQARDEEARALRDNLEISESRTVLLRADRSGAGRGGLIEEWVRLNPDFTVYRLNERHFASMDEYNGKLKLKSIMLDLERQASAGAKIALVVENPAALQQGSGFQPIEALWESMGFPGNKLYKIVQADNSVVKSQIKDKYPALQDKIIIMDVLPAAYEGVLASLMQLRSSLEGRGIKFTQKAIDEIARLAVRHRSRYALRWASELMKGSENFVYNQKTQGALNRDRLAAQLRQARIRFKSLEEDLKAETNPAEKASTQKDLDALGKQIDELGKDIARLGTVTEDPRNELKQLEIDIVELQAKVDSEQAKRGTFGRKTPAHIEFERQLEAKSAQKAKLEDDITFAKRSKDLPPERVTVDHVRQIASKWLNIPVARLTGGFDEGIRNLKNVQVFGQNHVMKQIEDVLVLSSTKLNDGIEVKASDINAIRRGEKIIQEQPIGVFMFAGPTGVGKTETARELSKTLKMELLRFNMSEFQAEHTVSRFMGSPPGYVGQDSIGQLLQQVKDNPESIILFDEIEKAHPKVLTALMNMIDAGFMTSANGEQTIDFRKTIVIFTTNLVPELSSLSKQQLVERILQFDNGNKFARLETDIQVLRREAWRLQVIAEGKILPEVAARISNIIAFNKLDTETAARISQKLMRQLKSALKIHDIDLVVTADAIGKMMSYFNEDEGGRSLKRAFTDFFRRPLAYAVYNNKLSPGTLALGLSPNKEELQFRVASDAEFKAATADEIKSNGLEAFKNALVSERTAGKNLETRKALAATSDVVRNIFQEGDIKTKGENKNKNATDVELRTIISERAFRKLRLVR